MLTTINLVVALAPASNTFDCHVDLDLQRSPIGMSMDMQFDTLVQSSLPRRLWQRQEC
jgi:hypothetical protein